MVAADFEDALYVAIADAGDAEERFAGGLVDVYGEELGVGAGPGGLGVFGEGELRVFVGGELCWPGSRRSA